MTALEKEKTYTINDIISLPDGKRAELIDGYIYDLATPSTIHQRIVSRLNTYIGSHITEVGKDCEVFPAPFGMFLDDENYLEPDLSVICDKNKLSDRGCEGAPDWVIEITSTSTQRNDYMTKLFKYRIAGVRLYWVINPEKQIVNVWDFENGESALYSFSDSVPVSICKSFAVRLDDIL